MVDILTRSWIVGLGLNPSGCCFVNCCVCVCTLYALIMCTSSIAAVYSIEAELGNGYVRGITILVTWTVSQQTLGEGTEVMSDNFFYELRVE